jgi:hypothetical protein
MRLIALLATMLLAAPAAAQNLLVNPDFDLDPTIAGNGWSKTGTGTLVWFETFGDPSPPCARSTQNGAESMILYQCVHIVGGATYDFSGRSFTHSSIGLAHNSVSLSVYATDDCSGAPIENVETNQNSFPNFSLRQRFGYVAPLNARSARIELLSDAGGTTDDISWDTIILTGPATAVESGTWGTIKSFYR